MGKNSFKANNLRRSWQTGLLPAALAAVALALACGDTPGQQTGSDPELSPEVHASADFLRNQRAQRDATVWKTEAMAQAHEARLVALWDALLEAGRRGDARAKFRVLGDTDPGQLILGTPQEPQRLGHGIEASTFGPPLRTLDKAGWRELLARIQAEGFVLVQSEWHHARFEPQGPGNPARSRVAVVLHGIHEPSGRRIAIDGQLDVEWKWQADTDEPPRPARVDASGLRMLTRDGVPAFAPFGGFPPGAPRGRLHPLVVYDLDRNGFDDVLMLGAGRILWNRNGRRFEETELFRHPQPLAEAGAVADFNGDGFPDLLAARTRGDLLLYAGDAQGRFLAEPRITPRLQEPLRGPSALAVGDIDADGDLDAWLGQYKPPYLGGQMPTPFYDANDGWPSYLLRNRGDGRFELATEAAGLAERNLRRTYASTFVDLDDDADLDLVVISDFSGVDLYANDGQGNFLDANPTLAADRHLFGMSSSFADYDLDGKLDFFVAGMGSTTARRMEAAGLGREDRPQENAMRMRMAYGNRMYLADPSGWREPSFHADVARTGWTWGTTSLDFDNDGDSDIFAANGHESGESTKDYCSTFWRHDIFDADSAPNASLENIFAEEGRGFASGAESWDGYQKNHLLMNQDGLGFINVAFLLGLADEFDSRSAISTDLDRDGRMDLLVIEDSNEAGQQLHAYRNELENDNHFVGVELREEAGRLSPVGALVEVEAGGRRHVKPVLVGESIMGQHSTTLHFGLGSETKIEAIRIRWPGGAAAVLPRPAADRYHRIKAPTRPSAP